MTLILALAAVVPALLVMWYVHARDAYPEPPRVVWTTFVLGALSIAPALVLEWLAAWLLHGVHGAWAHGLAEAFIGAAAPEDLMKFCVLYFYVLRHHEFNEPMDGLVYGVAASMGFALVENCLYVYQYGMGTAIARALTAIPSHGAHGIIMGYFLALAHFRPSRRRGFLISALLLPMVFHTFYDFPVMTAFRLAPSGDGNLDAMLWAGLNGMVLLVASLEFGMALALIKRLQTLQGLGTETTQPHQTLDRHHEAGAAGRRLAPWLQIGVGGLLAWLGFLSVVGATQTGVLAADLALWIALGVAGAAVFRRGIVKLNLRAEPVSI
ncbi:MAG: PrsW family glutamic-type intramembrane protease [Gammaproteobacteria bacterium]